MQFDLSPADLAHYHGSVREPDDFDAFWSATLEEARRHTVDVRSERVRTPLAAVEIHDITFNGFAGQPVKAWLRVPAGITSPLPTVVEFVGYGGGRGIPEDALFWSTAGFAHLQMDTRGQGATWSPGDTPDPDGTGPHTPGMMTAGIEDPYGYYYRRLITDAVRAIDAAAELDAVDPERIIAHGVSQGGGLALAATALNERVSALFACVPFLCDFPRAITVTDADPYKEISRYLAVHRARESEVLTTLSYVDGVCFARRATAPAVFTTSLMDTVCPPSTVFAAFNEYAAQDKQIWVHSHNGHEGGGREDAVRYVSERFRRE
ncbi:acetylxylan esterase [Leifsonia shinshuensis]|uniref:acetylxylan esterase n=1 Tax=Leifsonia shinshuensis TaxID=150026 RepID=UPI001F5080AB|nr:acetylxylan esterase [Leifsonia shinshuensis]MCI0158746.1 acetylxylan esterase [Leifsonia shinshuensis]